MHRTTAVSAMAAHMSPTPLPFADAEARASADRVGSAS
jgi:hypothetical protein